MNTAIHTKGQLFRIRLYYFILTGAGGFIMPFISLFYRRQGMTGNEIGLLGMVSAVTALIVAPIWGHWSDQAANPGRLLQVAFLGSAVVYLLISQQAAFVWLALLTCLRSILGAGVDPMSDAMTVSLLKGQTKTGFGSIRLWGSLGWALVVLLSGWLIEKTGILSAFVGYAVMMIASALVVRVLNFGPGKKKNQSAENSTASTQKVFHLIRRDRALVGLALAIGIVWLTRTGIYQFQAIYLDLLGAGESLIGLTSTLGALVELPGMLWADHLIRRYGSHRILGITMLLYAVMHAFVVLYPSVTAIMVAAALGGVTFSFYSVGIVVFLSERAPLGQTATVLALYTSTLRGMIAIAGAPLAGLVFDFAGAYWLYVTAMGGSLLSALVFRLLVTGKRSQVGETTGL